jgi:pimeloyl-ACP methyl ester carboxylesterase
VHLVGHSSGARYALHAALRIPTLKSLVLYDPPDREAFSDAVLDRLAGLEAAGDREGVLRTFFVDMVGVTAAEFSALKQRPVWPLMVDNALTVPAELRAARSYRFDPATFSALAVPTLVLVGQHSGPELRRVADEIAGALPDAGIVTLAGQGHGAMFSGPELLASVLQRFFDNI